MADRHTASFPSPSVSADLDAYRRHRASSPRESQAGLITTLDALKPSPQPQVMFARLADAVSKHFADGCQIELNDGIDPPLSLIVRRDDMAPRRQSEPGTVAEAVFQIPSRGGQPSYAGILSIWWNHRPITDSDQIAAELLVRHISGLVDRQRLMDRAGASEARAAVAAMEAISSRQLNLAVGILMAQNRCSAEDAETLLTDLADARGAELFTVAAETVRSLELGPHEMGDPGASLDGDSKSNVRVFRPLNNQA